MFASLIPPLPLCQFFWFPNIHMWMQLYGIWYLSFYDWLSSFSISRFYFSHVIVNGFISSLLMTEWCRSVYIYHTFLPIHLPMDICAVSTVWLLLIMLLQTLGCVSLLESTKVLLYPRAKYLALQFWNHRVALFLTSFLFFFMIVTEREAETQAEGEAGSMHREPDVGIDPGSPGSPLGQRQAPNRCATQGSQTLDLNAGSTTH